MSTPHVEKLVRSGFIPPGIAERLNKTLPGRLADAVDTLLYHLHEQTQEGSAAKLWVDPKLYVGWGVNEAVKKVYPEVPGTSEDGAYMDVQRALREVYHYLHACALREVLK